MLIVVIVTVASFAFATSSRAQNTTPVYASDFHDATQAFLESFAKLHNDSNDRDAYSTALSHALHHAGYLGATLTTSADGGIVVHLGEVTTIELRGFTSTKSKQEASRILTTHLIGKPLLAENLERGMMLVNDLSDASSTFRLNEDQPGKYTLIVFNQATSRFTSLQYDFTPPQEFKRHRLNLSHQANSIFKGGDQLRLTALGISGDGDPSQLALGAQYRTNLNTNGLFGIFQVSDLRSRVQQISGPSLDFDGTTYSAALGYPVQRDTHGYGYLIGELLRTEEKIQNFSNENQVNAARLIYVYKQQSSDSTLTDMSIALTTGKESNGVEHFSHVKLGFGRVYSLHEIKDKTHIKVDVLAQFSDGETPASERFYLGSTEFLRGYDFGSEQGDEGGLITLELVNQLNSKHPLITGSEHGVFYDAGTAKIRSSTNPDRSWKGLSSLGYKFRLSFVDYWQVEGWVAKPLEENSSGEKPDVNLYLRASKSWW